MSLKNKLISLGIALSSLSVFGQDIDPDAYGYYQNALSFSQSYFGGSARVQGLAGAQTALGADVSAPLSNPAGLGLFRKSTFTFSPTLRLSNSSTDFRSDLEQSSTINNKDNFNIGNIAVVFANTDNGGDWKSEGFAITFNRLNNYHSRVSYNGRSNNSFSDYLVDYGNNSSDNHFDVDADNNAYTYSGMAYQTYAIDYDSLGFFHYNQLNDIEVIQKEEIVTKGAKNQWDFGYGANYQNKLFLGASIGIPTIRKEEQRSYTETFIDYYWDEQGETVSEVNFNETITTRGTGINAKLGLIYKMNDIVRVGASIESPTYYSIREEVEASMTNVYFVEQQSLNDEVILNNEYSFGYVPLTFKYNLRTPYKANGGLSLFFGKRGFISTDVELVGYDRMRLSSSDDDDINNLVSFSGDNQTISNIYKATFNYRIGGEFRYENFRLRAGYAYYGDPIRSDVDNIDLSRQFFTGGFGLKFPAYFIDLSTVYNTHNEGNTRYVLYDNSEPTTVSQFSNIRIMLTVGTTF